MNSGTRLCSFIPETRNIVVSEAPDQSYVLKTGNGKRGVLRWSPNSPSGNRRFRVICVDLLQIVLGDMPDDFVDVLPGLKLKWQRKHANQRVRIRVIDQETPQVQFTLQDIQHEDGFHLLNLDKLHQKHSGGLSEDEKNRLFQLARDESMMTARTKLLKEIQAGTSSDT